jgi:hypothetical protein
MADVVEGGELHDGQRICCIPVCSICNCNRGNEGIYRCAEHCKKNDEDCVLDAFIDAMTLPEKEKGSRKGAKINVKDISWDDIVLGEHQEKAGGPMVQSCITIGGFDAMALTTVELQELVANLKLTGYHSKSKFDVL